jgi:hypothetical protein
MFGPVQGKALRPRKRARAEGDYFSHRDLSRRTGYPYVNFVTDQESRLWASSHGSFSASAQGCWPIC